MFFTAFTPIQVTPISFFCQSKIINQFIFNAQDFWPCSLLIRTAITSNIIFSMCKRSLDTMQLKFVKDQLWILCHKLDFWRPCLVHNTPPVTIFLPELPEIDVSIRRYLLHPFGLNSNFFPDGVGLLLSCVIMTLLSRNFHWVSSRFAIEF